VTDTLAYSKRLQEAGVPVAQADAHARAAHEFFSGAVATKADITELRQATKHDFADVRHELATLRHEIAALENRLIIKLGAIMIALAGLTLAIARMLW